MGTEPAPSGLQQSVTAIVKQGLTILLLLMLSGLAGSLPGADVIVFGRIPIAVFLSLGMSVAVVILLLTVYRQAVRVLGAFILTSLHGQPEDRALASSAEKVARSVTLLLYACLLYGAFLRGGRPLVVLLTAATWPLTAVRLGCLAVALIAIVGTCVGASPLFGEVGRSLAGRVVPAPADAPAPAEPEEPPLPGKCPKCGVLNDEGAKFCKFCGRFLPRESMPPTAGPTTQTCAACGAIVSPPARFCSACGKALPETG